MLTLTGRSAKVFPAGGNELSFNPIKSLLEGFLKGCELYCILCYDNI